MSPWAIKAVMFLWGNGSAKLSHFTPLFDVRNTSWFVTRIKVVSERRIAFAPKKTDFPSFSNANVSAGSRLRSLVGDGDVVQATTAAATMNTIPRRSMQQISTTLTRVGVVLLLVIGLLYAPSLSAQVAFRDLDVSTLKNPGVGYYFIAPNSMDSISMLDHAGKNIFKRRVGPHANVQTYQGKWLTHFATVGNTPVFIRRDIQLNPIDTLATVNGAKTDFHECRIISDTSYIILGVREDTVDLTSLPGGNPRAIVWNNVIQERTFSGRTLFEWRSLDHIPVADAIDSVEVTTPVVDYIHINSVVVDTDGNYLVSCRHTDEVIKINRTNGSVMWRLGGSLSKGNEFQWLNDSVGGFTGFSHQHSAVRTKRGTILLFDNGNFKPGERVSRVVEYEVDEQAKTVRKVFEFIPTPTVYASTMGSVQELPNEHIVIGWGSGSNRTVAHEIDRSGTVHVRIDNPTQSGFVAYRVVKSVFAMTGIERTLTAVGTTTFADADSTTFVAVVATRVTDSTRVTVERHNYPPHAVSFVDTTYCSVIPMRWTVRAVDSSKIAGSLRFIIRDLPGVTVPSKAMLFARPREGRGTFSRVVASYDSTTGFLSTNTLRYGEFLLAFSDCSVPLPIYPANGSTEIPMNTQLRWSPALHTDGYQVELSQSANFTPSRIIASFDEQTSPAELIDNTWYYWRVRTILPRGVYGSWSPVYSFRTQLPVPIPVSPVLRTDTIASPLPLHLVWTHSRGASTYRYRIVPVDRRSDSVSSVTSDTSVSNLLGLLPNTWYEWSVRPISDSGIVGRWSESARFFTAPLAPTLRSPLHDAERITVDRPRFEWFPVNGAVRYVISIRNASDGRPIAVDSTTGLTFVPDTLPMNTRCVWSVRAVGRYGPGPSSKSWSFSTMSSFVLDAPTTIAPKSIDQVDTVMASFLWSRVEGATSYDLQVTTQGTFASPEIEVLGVANPFCDVPLLRPGAAYQWRVIGYTDTAVGRWSDTATFTTRPRFEQSLLPLSPAREATDVPLRGVFRFSTSPAYVEYEAQVSRDPFFSTIEYTFRSLADTVEYYGLSTATQYYWRIVGFLSGDRSDIGQYSTFTTTTSTSVHTVSHTMDGVVVKQGTDGIIVYLPTSDLFTVSVFDLQGRRILTHHTPAPAETIFLPFTAHARGCYLLEIHRDTGTQTSVLIFCE